MAKEPVPGMPGYEADRVMRAVSYDSVLIQAGVTEYKLFVDEDDSAADDFRYNNENESNVVKWLLTSTYDPNMELTRKELNIPRNYRFYPEVKKPIITDQKVPGDIDLLAIDALHPESSLGIQVKRVKARISENGGVDIYTKLIPKAVFQAGEMMRKYRFHRNYLMLILVTDTQYHNHGFQLFRNLSFDEKQRVYQHPALKELHEEVGLYLYELSQPSKNTIGQTATIAVKQHRPAKLLEQPSYTTEKIVEFLKTKHP
jgi:hypothetical protein